MSFRKMPRAEVREGDSTAMAKAIEHLNAAGVEVRRPHGNAHQLKVVPFEQLGFERVLVHEDAERLTFVE